MINRRKQLCIRKYQSNGIKRIIMRSACRRDELYQVGARTLSVQKVFRVPDSSRLQIQIELNGIFLSKNENQI